MIEKLKLLSLFVDIDDNTLGKICDFSKIKTYEKDFVLFYEGQVIDNLLFLLNGSVDIYKFDRFGNKKYLYNIDSMQENQDNLLLINHIDFREIKTFGNACIYEKSDILNIDCKKLIHLARQNTNLFSNLCRQIILKNQKLDEVINRDIIFDAIAKLAYTLDKNLYRFNLMQRQEIAYRLNIQPETLSRILKKLKQDRIIESDENSEIKVIDKKSLQEIYKI
ncbi:Crp/Fnr family transcriptional regulator [Helicobacter cappadocius]|uniref:Crp/Fnr family transcriptional regulator n=1 Tax=Helicobacter cappadocius TaxID=3063998 RepID=A0AA90PR39_9HELI|nr:MULTISPECIES: Crp/Fnr family transcriptional regulator [unclassified Helicobacter]MDO7253469.1 Crp/Fnr family transcriptional regulator [Helicobacter sp. faydin-H75]MDP2539396.1 Crp/Fnr family transcriptional regulator [Helicobacter sp. faydin-H76]